jgi:protein SCO1/2
MEPTGTIRRLTSWPLIVVPLACALAAAGAVALVTLTIPGASAQLVGPAMPSNLRAPDFALRDQEGRMVRLGAQRGHVVVLAFMHSLCRDTCPLAAQQIRGAEDELGRVAAGVRTLAVSVLPSEDTRANRRHFVAKAHLTGRMRFLNGSNAQLRRIWRIYGIAPEKPDSPHSAYVFLIDRHGVVPVGYPDSDLTVDDLAHDLRVLLARS